MPDIITSAFGPDISWHQCWKRQTAIMDINLDLVMHFLPQHAHLAHFSSYQTGLSNVRDNQLCCLVVARHTPSLFCLSLAWLLKPAFAIPWRSLSWWLASLWDYPFSVARHCTYVTSVAHVYEGSTLAGATTNYLIRSCICISPYSGTRDRPHRWIGWNV